VRQRVVVTGVGLTSPIGHTFKQVSEALQKQAHGIVKIPEWEAIDGLNTNLAGVVSNLDLSKQPRKKIRTMGRVARLALYATEQAIADAALDDEMLYSGRVGLAYGSTNGSTSALESFARDLLKDNSLNGLMGSSYFKFMSHTCVANLAQAFGIRGRIIPTISACASGSQGIGYGYETICSGKQDVMLCGGAEEIHFMSAGIFDIMYATSTAFNDRPDESPRPFDRRRDGLVVAEGAGTVVLEGYEHAKARGVPIYGEIIGFGTNCDGHHITYPSVEGMIDAIRLALQDAGLNSDQIDYINAHGTATEPGDIAESQATLEVMGDKVPISSTKSHIGHTLGACGAIEAIYCLAMMRDGFIPNTRNLEQVDSRCAALDYVRDEPRSAALNTVMTNNFAFGGINTSLIIRRI
jgi:3-oxoacyl-[acyl-carrier-protein] synthase II